MCAPLVNDHIHRARLSKRLQLVVRTEYCVPDKASRNDCENEFCVAFDHVIFAPIQSSRHTDVTKRAARKKPPLVNSLIRRRHPQVARAACYLYEPSRLRRPRRLQPCVKH